MDWAFLSPIPAAWDCLHSLVGVVVVGVRRHPRLRADRKDSSSAEHRDNRRSVVVGASGDIGCNWKLADKNRAVVAVVAVVAEDIAGVD